MTSKKERWAISKISNSARKNIETLDIEVQEKIISRLEHLQENPFGGEVRKVQGKKNIFREKVDDYRIDIDLIVLRLPSSKVLSKFILNCLIFIDS